MSIKLTPKRVAQAIGVSESSMKRWCDRGLIDFQKTAGGHRRLKQSSVVAFLRGSDHDIVKPELLGLPAGVQRSQRPLDDARHEFFRAAIAGDRHLSQRILIEQYLAEKTIAEIGDQVINPVFEQISRKMEIGELESHQLRSACDVTLAALSQIRELLPTPEAGARLAIVAALPGDNNELPTTQVELVLHEMGWRTHSLGADLPLAMLAAAVQNQRPYLLCLNVSGVVNNTDFLDELERFRQQLNPETFLIVGGQALNGSVRKQMKHSAFGENLQQLQALARSLTFNSTINHNHKA